MVAILSLLVFASTLTNRLVTALTVCTEYVYEVAVPKALLPAEYQAALDEPATMLPAWVLKWLSPLLMDNHKMDMV